jgi:hypothetical protein
MNKNIYYLIAGFVLAFALTLLRPSIGRYQLIANGGMAEIDTTNGVVWIFDAKDHKWIELTKLKQ